MLARRVRAGRVFVSGGRNWRVLSARRAGGRARSGEEA